MDNYREYLSKNEATKGKHHRSVDTNLDVNISELSLKSTDDLLNELTFFSKPSLPHEVSLILPYVHHLILILLDLQFLIHR